MSREIKFRFWSLIGRDGHMIYTDRGVRFDHNDLKAIPGQWYVMQFTGLKDKEGKEIFEGDVADYSWTGQFGDEFVQRGQFVNVLMPMGYASGFKDIGDRIETGRVLDKNMRGQFAVIGNIHENPELLNP